VIVFLLAGGLVLLGAVSGATGLVLLGVLAALQHWLSSLWSRRGLAHVTYGRRLARDRAVWGDVVPMEIEVENRKLLPLAWLRADDHVSEEARFTDRTLVDSHRPGYGILRSTWTLRPFERIRRVVHLDAVERGRWIFDIVDLSVADVFGWDAAGREETHEATFLVRPRTVPVRSSSGAIVPDGTRRARTGLMEDPALFAGVRPFQRGDPQRRIHQRATARLGQPMSRRFEPSITRTVVIALDVQTTGGPYWVLTYDEDLVETLAVVAGSLARRLLGEGVACGLALNGWTYTTSAIGYVAPLTGGDQLTRITDLLARMSPISSAPYPRLLAELPPRLPPGALVLTLGTRDLTPAIPSLRRLRASGFDVRHVAVGPHALEHAGRARRAGIDAATARLDPDWRTSDVLSIAS
jgi:uncharacterized protein (DUF58 family)